MSFALQFHEFDGAKVFLYANVLPLRLLFQWFRSLKCSWNPIEPAKNGGPNLNLGNLMNFEPGKCPSFFAGETRDENSGLDRLRRRCGTVVTLGKQRQGRCEGHC